MATLDAVEAARMRRFRGAARKEARFQWFIKEVSNKVAMTLKARMSLATQHVQDKCILNISRPVTKIPSRITGRIVVRDRSRPGEFPKADTTQLMKTLFKQVISSENGVIT